MIIAFKPLFQPGISKLRFFKKTLPLIGLQLGPSEKFVSALLSLRPRRLEGGRCGGSQIQTNQFLYYWQNKIWRYIQIIKEPPVFFQETTLGTLILFVRTII